MELGLVFWAERDPETHLRELADFGLNACQLGVPPAMNCKDSAEPWKRAIAGKGVFVSSAVCSYAGEDYANLERVHQTVGFTAPGYAAERIERTKEVSAFAADLGLTALSCHIGFIPDDADSSLYSELLNIGRELCDLCAAHGQDFVLETGQESAVTLLQFLDKVERPNIKVNFDPANMILYGSGDPVQALQMLAQRVLSVHCKDGLSPKASGQLGKEVGLGNGEVDFPGFLQLLKNINYQGLLTIEREEPDVMQRGADIRLGVERLTEWKRLLS